jgi:hypothetical protein
MKPTPQIQPRNFPLTDCSYQTPDVVIETPTTVVGKTIRQPQLRSFWKISAGYSGAEATLDFAAEAILFASISAVAAWPITVLLHQLLRWMI